MARVTLYTEPGNTSIFLGEVELGEQEFTEPTVVFATNTSIYELGDVTVTAEGSGAQFVQFSLDGEAWSTKAEIGKLGPKKAKTFQTRIKTPPVDAGPSAYTFEFVTKSIETA